ncbi:MAG: M48 family metallopeptidase, partial [Clostridia bacterium]|nr:M48 family metallopeptidase [Clostridia bacterium]
MYAFGEFGFKWRKCDLEYRIIRSGRRTLSLEIKNGEVLVRAPYYVRDADIEQFVAQHAEWIEKHVAQMSEVSDVVPLTDEELNALAEQAVRIIPERVKLYAERIGVTYGRITIRNQRTKWGSCSAQGNLNFNCLLMLAPTEVLDSVIVHELCHRKEMNHSKRFYDEVYKAFPEYKKWNAWLKQ